MDVAQSSVIEGACRQLFYRYAVAVDSRDLGKLLSCFPEQFLWRRPGTQPMRTTEEVRAFFEHLFGERAKVNPHGHLTRHLMTTMSIEVESAERATGVTYAMVFRDGQFEGKGPSPMPENPELLVEYRDIFGLTPRGWKIVDHEARHVFRAGFYNQPPMRNPTPEEAI